MNSNRRRLGEDDGNVGLHPTSKQLAELSERSNRLRRKIASWIEIQELHMPEARFRRKQLEKAAPDGIAPRKTQDIPLVLPSSLGKVQLIGNELREYEWRLREGQAYDALHDMRQHLRLRAHCYKHKDRFSRGVRENLRSQTTIKKVQVKVDRAARKYRAARAALVSLSKEINSEDWKARMKPLKELVPGDVRGLSDGLEGESEGKRTISWIWLVSYGPMAGGDEEQTNEGMHPLLMLPRILLIQTQALRIEWCRSRARAMRFSEEVELLNEEMRRVLAFLEWETRRWEERATERIRTGAPAAATVDPTVAPTMPVISESALDEGLHAYALRQAAIRRQLFNRFSTQWKDIPTFIHTSNDMLEDPDPGVQGTKPSYLTPAPPIAIL